MLWEIVQNKLDILLVLETKLDPSFPSSQFAIEGFGFPFRLDRKSLGGGVMVFVREEISSKLFKSIQAKQLSWIYDQRSGFCHALIAPI